MVTLRNLTKRKITINLDHDVVCGSGKCGCQETTMRSRVLNPKTGESGTREIPLRLCGSVHLMPGGTSGQLPDSVKELDEVKAGTAGRTPSLAINSVSSAIAVSDA